MKEIYWKKLSLFKKFILVLGFIPFPPYIFFLGGMIAMKLRYYGEGYEKKSYDKFFNPNTLKSPYVVGWIHLAILTFWIIISLI